MSRREPERGRCSAQEPSGRGSLLQAPAERRSWSPGRARRPAMRAVRATQRPLYVTLGWGSALKGLARVPWSQSGQDCGEQDGWAQRERGGAGLGAGAQVCSGGGSGRSVRAVRGMAWVKARAKAGLCLVTQAPRTMVAPCTEGRQERDRWGSGALNWPQELA